MGKDRRFIVFSLGVGTCKDGMWGGRKVGVGGNYMVTGGVVTLKKKVACFAFGAHCGKVKTVTS